MEENVKKLMGSLDEFDSLVERFSKDNDYETFQNQIQRWKRRTVETLRDFVPSQDLMRFERADTKPTWVLGDDNFRSIINEHRTYLTSLYHDMVNHPDSYGKGVVQRSRSRAASPVQSRPLALPERVTLAWLFRHVPVGYWVSLVVILFGAFVAGLRLGLSPDVARVVAPALGVELPDERSSKQPQ